MSLKGDLFIKNLSIILFNYILYRIPPQQVKRSFNLNKIYFPRDFPFKNVNPEAGISKNYGAINSGSPEVKLRFCPCPIFFKY
jgi:hypothetical protein